MTTDNHQVNQDVSLWTLIVPILPVIVTSSSNHAKVTKVKLDGILDLVRVNVNLGTMVIVNPDEDVYMFEHYILFQSRTEY